MLQKRPHALSAYNLFFKEALPTIKAEGSTSAENMKKIGEMWKNMDRSDQEKYHLMAQAGKAKMEQSKAQGRRTPFS